MKTVILLATLVSGLLGAEVQHLYDSGSIKSCSYWKSVGSIKDSSFILVKCSKEAANSLRNGDK